MASYVDTALTEGERIVYKGHLSWWTQFWYVFLGILLAVVLVGIVLLIMAWIRRASTELAITNKRVIAKFGFVSRDTIEINLQKIETVQVTQTVMQRLLNYGTIVIAGGGTPQEPIPGVADPMAFRKAFLEAQEAALQHAH
jgi:uncharacterized membrane protein YdbT with pleckstrin-like domain